MQCPNIPISHQSKPDSSVPEYVKYKRKSCDRLAANTLQRLGTCTEKLQNELKNLNVDWDEKIADEISQTNGLKYFVGSHYDWYGCDRCRVLVRMVKEEDRWILETTALEGTRPNPESRYVVRRGFVDGKDLPPGVAQASDSLNGKSTDWNSYPVNGESYTSSIAGTNGVTKSFSTVIPQRGDRPKGDRMATADPALNQRLIEAATRGDAALVKTLLDKGADGNAAANSGVTPLMCASYTGRTSIVEMLLQKGVDPNAAAKDGETALIKASCKGQVDVVKLLLDKGADGNAAANSGVTPLMCASYTGHAAIVEMLLQKGVDPNAADKDGETALIKTSCKGQVGVVKLLLAAGADKDAQTNKGITSLRCASAMGHIEVVEVLTGEKKK